MKTKKPGKKPRSFLQKIKVLFGASVMLVAVYLLYGYFNFWQLGAKSAELPGVRLYSVQESNYTHAFSWYASYPKIDDAVFDRAVSKIANDAKGAFLAKVNFDAPTKQPHDDLNISYVVDKSTELSLVVRLTVQQTLHATHKVFTKEVSYNNKTHSVAITDSSPNELVDTSTKTKKGTLPTATTGTDCKKQSCVALTFDGGPTYVTPQLLDTLKAAKAKATFFELGAQAQLYPSTAKRTVAEGHVVGNGTYTHRNLLTLSSSQIADELNRGSDAIAAASGIRPGIARAPYGAITSDIAKQAGVSFIGWNISSSDVQGSRADSIYSAVMSQVKPGAIIESHDIRQETADAYRRIIPDLIAKGYTLVTAPQLLDFNSDTQPGLYTNS